MAAADTITSPSLPDPVSTGSVAEPSSTSPQSLVKLYKPGRTITVAQHLLQEATGKGWSQTPPDAAKIAKEITSTSPNVEPGADLITVYKGMRKIKVAPHLLDEAKDKGWGLEPPQSAMTRMAKANIGMFGVPESIVDTPSEIVEGIKAAGRDPALLKDSLVAMYHGLNDAQQELIDRAYTLQHQKGIANKAEGFATGVLASIPMFGPAIYSMGDKASSGDYAGAFGSGLALFEQLAIGGMRGAEAPHISTFRTAEGTAKGIKPGAPGTAEHAAHQQWLAAHPEEQYITKPTAAVAKTISDAADNARRSAKEVARMGLQRTLNAGPRLAGEVGERYQAGLEKTRAENTELRQQLEGQSQTDTVERRQKHEQDVAEYARKTEEIRAGNEQAQAGLKARADIEKQIADKRKEIEDNTAQSKQAIESQVAVKQQELLDRNHDAEAQARVDEKTAWDDTRNKIQQSGGPQGLNGQSILDAVEDAFNKDLKGTSPEWVATFRDIVSALLAGDEEGRGASPLWDEYQRLQQQAARGTGAVVPKGSPLAPTPGAASVATTIDVPFDQAHGWATELGYIMSRYSREAPYDVKRAMKRVRDSLTTMMDDIATANGAMPELKTARDATIRKKEAFGRERPTVQSAAAKVERAQASEAVKARELQNRLNKLGAIDPDIPVVTAEIADLQRQLKELKPDATLSQQLNDLNTRLHDMPSESVLKGQLKPPPDEPVAPVEVSKYKPGTPEPVPESIYEARKTKLRDAIASMQRLRPWEWEGLIGGTAAAFFTGHRLLSAAVLPTYLLGKHLLMTALEKDRAINWIAKPGPKDLIAIGHLPPEIQAPLRLEINKFIADEARDRGGRIGVNPLLNKWLAKRDDQGPQGPQGPPEGPTGGGPTQPPPTEPGPSGGGGAAPPNPTISSTRGIGAGAGESAAPATSVSDNPVIAEPFGSQLVRPSADHPAEVHVSALMQAHIAFVNGDKVKWEARNMTSDTAMRLAVRLAQSADDPNAMMGLETKRAMLNIARGLIEASQTNGDAGVPVLAHRPDGTLPAADLARLRTHESIVHGGQRVMGKGVVADWHTDPVIEALSHNPLEQRFHQYLTDGGYPGDNVTNLTLETEAHILSGRRDGLSVEEAAKLMDDHGEAIRRAHGATIFDKPAPMAKRYAELIVRGGRPDADSAANAGGTRKVGETVRGVADNLPNTVEGTTAGGDREAAKTDYKGGRDDGGRGGDRPGEDLASIRRNEPERRKRPPTATLSELATLAQRLKVSARTAKYKHGNTQATIPDSSEAGKSLESARAAIDPSDLMGHGKDVGGNHITVRYGITGGDTTGIRKFIESQSPFEATLGKTTSFPPSEHSDGAVPIIVPINAPKLYRLESEMDKHGDFAERSFPEYRPHATIAYVKPDKADRYVGISETDGKKFTIDTIAITDQNGNETLVRLKGKPTAQAAVR